MTTEERVPMPASVASKSPAEMPMPTSVASKAPAEMPKLSASDIKKSKRIMSLFLFYFIIKGLTTKIFGTAFLLNLFYTIIIFFVLFFKSTRYYYQTFIYFWLCIDIYFIMWFLYVCNYEKNKRLNLFLLWCKKKLIWLDFCFLRIYSVKTFLFIFIFIFFIMLTTVILYNDFPLLKNIFLSFLMFSLFLRVVNSPFRNLKIAQLSSIFYYGFLEQRQNIYFNIKNELRYFINLKKNVHEEDIKLIANAGVDFPTGVSFFINLEQYIKEFRIYIEEKQKYLEITDEDISRVRVYFFYQVRQKINFYGFVLVKGKLLYDKIKNYIKKT